MARLLVIDDDEIGLHGRARIFEQLGHEVVAASFAEASQLGDPAGSVPDLVLAVVRPDLSAWDRFGSISRLGALRNRLGSTPRFVALVIGPAVDNPVIGLRLAHAGVDELLRRSEGSTTSALAGLVAGGVRGSDPRPSSRDLAMVGVGPGMEPEAVVAWVLERAEAFPAYLHAFEPGVTQNRSGLTRRQAINLRIHLARLGRVRPDPSRAGGGPVRDQSLPRWSEVVAVANLCRGCAADGTEQGDWERPGFDDGGWWVAAGS